MAERVGESLDIPFDQQQPVGIRIYYDGYDSEGNYKQGSVLINISSNADLADAAEYVQQQIMSGGFVGTNHDSPGLTEVTIDIQAVLPGGYDRGIAIVLPEVAEPGEQL